MRFPFTVLDLETTIKALRSEATEMSGPISMESNATDAELAGNRLINSGTAAPPMPQRRPRQLAFTFASERSNAAPELTLRVAVEETQGAERIAPDKKPCGERWRPESQDHDRIAASTFLKKKDRTNPN